MSHQEAYIFDAIRTPRGKGKASGSLHEVQAIDLLKTLFVNLKEKHNLDTSQIDDCVLGCVTPVGEQGADIARTATLYAGWNLNVSGVQLNRFCASGLESVNMAAAKVRSGWEDMVVAGGVESMSRVKMGMDGGAMFSNPKVSRQLAIVPQGISADLIATIEGFDRKTLDSLALLSQQRAAFARENGYFKSIVPVKDQNGLMILDKDEIIRGNSTLEGLGQLNPAFVAMGEMGFDAVAQQKYTNIERIKHLHTAGNSSGIVDGAALVLIGSKAKGEEMGLRPRAKITSVALAGDDPTIMLTAPAPASQKALKKIGMTLNDIDLIEVNEAFAAVVLKFMREMKLNDFDKINVNGGAIAMGHPLGATGSMMLGTVLDELERRDLNTALLTLCVGGGMGIATIIERV